MRDLLKELKHCQNARDLSPESPLSSTPSPISVTSPGHQEVQQSPLCTTTFITESPIPQDNTDRSLTPSSSISSISSSESSDNDSECNGSLLLSRSRFQYTNEELILEDKIATAKKYFEVKLMKKAFKAWRDMARTQAIRRGLRIEALTSSSSDEEDADVSEDKRMAQNNSCENTEKHGETEEKPQKSRKTTKKTKLIPGKTGLRNLGNTCFMNSVIQALAGISKFRKYFINMLWINQEKKNKEILSKNPHFLADFSFVNRPQKAFLRSSGSPLPATPGHEDSDTIVIKHTDECLNSVKHRNTSRRCKSEGDGDAVPVSMCQNLHELLRVMWSGKWAVVSPFAMLESLWRISPGFQGYQQQDAQEFLFTLFGRIQQEVAGGVFQPVRQKNNAIRSIIGDVFQGEIYTKIECKSCGNISARLETFLDLSLSVPVSKPSDVSLSSSRHKLIPNNDVKNNVKEEKENDNGNNSSDTNSNVNGKEVSNLSNGKANDFGSKKGSFCSMDDDKAVKEPSNTEKSGKIDIIECLHNFMDSESLGDDYVCDGCHQKTGPTKSCRLYKLPKVLCFVLKRFLWTPGKGGCGFTKIIKSVTFPFVLDIGPFCCKSSFEGKSMRYALQSMVCHHGSGLYSGHYTAYTTTDGKSWTHFNDSVVTSVDESDVLSDGRNAGYIFFYQCIEEEIPDPFDLPEPLRMAVPVKKTLSATASSSSAFLSSSLILSSSLSFSAKKLSSESNKKRRVKPVKRYLLRNPQIENDIFSGDEDEPKRGINVDDGDDDDVVIIGDGLDAVNEKEGSSNENTTTKEKKVEAKKYLLRNKSHKEKPSGTKRGKLVFPDPEPIKKKTRIK